MNVIHGSMLVFDNWCNLDLKVSSRCSLPSKTNHFNRCQPWTATVEDRRRVEVGKPGKSWDNRAAVTLDLMRGEMLVLYI